MCRRVQAACDKLVGIILICILILFFCVFVYTFYYSSFFVYIFYYLSVYRSCLFVFIYIFISVLILFVCLFVGESGVCISSGGGSEVPAGKRMVPHEGACYGHYERPHKDEAHVPAKEEEGRGHREALRAGRARPLQSQHSRGAAGESVGVSVGAVQSWVGLYCIVLCWTVILLYVRTCRSYCIHTCPYYICIPYIIILYLP